MTNNKMEVYTNKTVHSGAFYSQAIVSGSMVYVSGQIPLDPKTNMLISDTVYEQSIAVLNFLKMILEEAGCTMDDILKLNCYLANLNDFAEMNRAFESFFNKPYPARSTVGVQLFGVKVEMDCIARISEEKINYGN